MNFESICLSRKKLQLGFLRTAFDGFSADEVAVETTPHWKGQVTTKCQNERFWLKVRQTKRT